MRSGLNSSRKKKHGRLVRGVVVFFLLFTGADLTMPQYFCGGEEVGNLPLQSRVAKTNAGMEDCCATALEQSTSPEVSAARLCCAMNCSMPGSTGSAAYSAPQGATLAQDAIIPQPSVAILKTAPRFSQSRASTKNLPPTYILNLALLI
jgi:hypothetical protein